MILLENFSFYFLIFKRMMNIKSNFSWLYNRICDYNLFIPDEDDYDDDDEAEDPLIKLKHEKYTTRLYVILLIGRLLLL